MLARLVGFGVLRAATRSVVSVPFILHDTGHNSMFDNHPKMGFEAIVIEQGVIDIHQEYEFFWRYHALARSGMGLCKSPL